MDIKGNAWQVIVNLAAQALWVVLAGVYTITLPFLSGATGQGGLLGSYVQVPTWTLLAAGFLALAGGLLNFAVLRKSSVVRGRSDATSSNLALLKSRTKVPRRDQLIRSTRFGRWPPGEVLEQREAFRGELDQAILTEGADVRRIWNVRSLDDIARLREIMDKYQGRANHSIRAYFGLPYHALPELLVVERRGASMSFPSMRTPGLDWMIRFKRGDLVQVVRDYFDVLWDRAERMLDGGEVTSEGRQRLAELERALAAQSHVAG